MTALRQASAGERDGRSPWPRLRRACEREAVKRSWAAYWYGAADMAERERGDVRLAEHWRALANRAAERAARIRRAVLNMNAGRA